MKSWQCEYAVFYFSKSKEIKNLIHSHFLHFSKLSVAREGHFSQYVSLYLKNGVN